jgi:hypothetical protein
VFVRIVDGAFKKRLEMFEQSTDGPFVEQVSTVFADAFQSVFRLFQ